MEGAEPYAMTISIGLSVRLSLTQTLNLHSTEGAAAVVTLLVISNNLLLWLQLIASTHSAIQVLLYKYFVF